MQQLERAVAGLDQVTRSHPLQPSWLELVRERLTDVHEALTAEPATAGESWLVARASTVGREHERLLGRLSVLAATVVGSADLGPVHSSLRRLVTDLHHHLQRINDLAYDAVEMEVGGSE